MEKKLGFIGLGAMGKRMAANLVKAGYALTVYDIRKEAIDDVVKLGALPASSPKEVGEKSNIVFLSLPSSPQVEEVVLGKNGVIEGIKKGGIIIDLSTIDPTTTIKIAEETNKRNIRFIDAPVSGGTWGAEKATLAIMVGSDKKTFQEVYEVLKVIGKSIMHVGPVGTGQIVKLANNLMAAINLFGVIEAFTWAMKQGVKPEIVFNVVSAGAGDSWILRNYLPRMLKRNFEPGFRAWLMHKDIGLFLKSATDQNIYTPFAALTYQFLQAVKGQGLEDEDWTAIVKIYEKITGVKLEKLDFSI